MHLPVLADEVLDLLNVKQEGTYVDCTLGSGGHAKLVLEQLGEGGTFLGIDRDVEALERSRERTKGASARCILAQGGFADMVSIAASHGITSADGILMDLGVSSEQLDVARRGFSFAEDGPLDMRMDRSAGLTAADLVNSMSLEEMEKAIKFFGEEPAARRIARAIVRERGKREIHTTLDLAAVVCRAKGGKRGRIHPATKAFQAFRILVNEELDQLKNGLEEALMLLNGGGRLAVISFHSLEDRLVKRCFKEHAGRWESQQAGGRTWHRKEPPVLVLTKKPMTATEEEIKTNPRARSAKLRGAEKTTDTEVEIS